MKLLGEMHKVHTFAPKCIMFQNRTELTWIQGSGWGHNPNLFSITGFRAMQL